ncbi:MAG: hypothetical protein V4805_11510 [Pseudomonadota bacterium]
MAIDYRVFFIVLIVKGLLNHPVLATFIIIFAVWIGFRASRKWHLATLGRTIVSRLVIVGGVVAVIGVGGLVLGGYDFKIQMRDMVSCFTVEEQATDLILKSGKPDRFQLAMQLARQHLECKDLSESALRVMSFADANQQFSPSDLAAADQILKQLYPTASICSGNGRDDAVAAIHIGRHGIDSLREALDARDAAGQTCWGLQAYFTKFGQLCQGKWRDQCAAALPRERLAALKSDPALGGPVKDLMQKVWPE